MTTRTPTRLLRSEHGVIYALPIDADVRAPQLASALHDDERSLTTTWGELRVRTFAAGRIALRAALADPDVGVRIEGPILKDARGAPLLPPGVVASVSHKDELAIALAALKSDEGTMHVGVDVELLDEDLVHARRIDVSRHVLTARELDEVAHLDAAARRRETLTRFSLKEALYKALDPFVQRYVGFLEVEARPRADGSAEFTLALSHGEGPFHVEGRWTQVTEPMASVVTTVRVTRR